MEPLEIWTTAIVDKVLKPPRVYHHFPLWYSPPVGGLVIEIWTTGPYYKTLVHIIGSTLLMAKQVNSNMILFFPEEHGPLVNCHKLCQPIKWRYGVERMRKSIWRAGVPNATLKSKTKQKATYIGPTYEMKTKE